MLITPKLKLRSNEGTDPFSRDDFVFNWNLLDAAPGIASGLSSGRPSWDASQVGRAFLETDTQRIVIWTGSAWVDMLQPGQSFSSTIATPTIGTPANGSNATYSFPTITLIRPARLSGIVTIEHTCVQNGHTYFTFRTIMDTTTSSIRDISVRRLSPGTSTSADIFTTAIPFHTGLLAAGVHTPKIQIFNATGAYPGIIANATFTAHSGV